MLYGNIIFIKKTGGDGSKYPVTERSLKIGRSEECLIRIHNTQVALEHCQLIIEENGQAKLQDLSKQTILNGNLLTHEEVPLCHGDVFKVGERLARWEYLPTSKYYRQLLSPSGRLVAVVMPQQRSLEGQSTPGTSASFLTVQKNTSAGGKRRYSERYTSENSSAVKMRKSGNLDIIKKLKVDLPKFLPGHHGLKSTKLPLSGATIKGRRSTSGIVNSRTPKRKSRKSTLPSWKVNIVSPEAKSERKSLKSPTSLMNTLEIESRKSSKTSRIRTPQRNVVISDDIKKSASKSVLKTPLKTITESPVRSKGSINSSSTLSSKKATPKSMSSPRSARLIQSEKKLKYTGGKSPVLSVERNRLSLVLTRVDSPKKNSNRKLPEVLGPRSKEIISDVMLESNKVTKLSEKTPRRSKKTSIKAVESPKENLNSNLVTQTEANNLEKLSTPVSANKNISALGGTSDTKTDRKSPRLKSKSVSAKSTPQKLVKSVGKSKSSSSQKISSKTLESPLVGGSLNSKRSPRSSAKTPRKKSLSKGTSPAKGVRRKLSPNSSAERAAKKLKTSSPKKPDKNKKAALLVLGKANRKQLLSQNVKVLLKQKIVKKAIKQSSSNTQKSENFKKVAVSKPKKRMQKLTKKPKPKSKKKQTSQLTTASPHSKEKGESTPKGESVENISNKKINELSSSKLKDSVYETPEKSITSQSKKSEPPRPVSSKSPANETSVNFVSFDNSGNFRFSSSCRSSKRLSSKNDTGRPDFVELSPTALGLIPKNLEIFKTPKQSKRRSSSVVTVKNAHSTGIIKSASTSKIGSRKSVKFSSKDLSINSEFGSPNPGDKTDFDFGAVQTPDVSVDVFVSPLGDKSNASKKGLSELSRITFASIDKSELALTKIYRSNSEPRKCARKLLQSPQSNDVISFKEKEVTRSSRSANNSPAPVKRQSGAFSAVDSKTSSENFESTADILSTPKIQRSPRNSVSDVKVVLALLQSSRNVKSRKNDLSDLRGAKKLLTTTKVQKSPKNDLTDVRGVKKLLATPKVQRSPKNDLSDVRGVKKLLTTPKVQKSPKNDLTDVRGVKKLLATPKVQKSPRNDLTDVRGVKKLLATPKAQKSPKNDLRDVRGVKKLLTTPKVQKSPKNDLTDVRGVKKLLTTPKLQKSPTNDLSDVRGVKRLLATPKTQKSPKNDLSDVRGVKRLLKSPRVQKSPKNELLDVSGVQQLFGSSKSARLSVTRTNSVRGKRLLEEEKTSEESPTRSQKRLRSGSLSASGSEQPKSPKAQRTSKSLSVEVRSEVAEGSGSPTKSKKVVSRKSHVTDFRAIRGRRNIHPTPKGPKNDLSDVTGVRELFARHTSASTFDMDLTGVAELFNLPETEVVPTPKARKSTRTRVPKVFEEVEDKKVEPKRSTRTVKKAKEPTTRAAVGVKSRSRVASAKKTSVEKSKQARVKSSSAGKKSQRTVKAPEETDAEPKVQNSRKRKAAVKTTSSPPKLRRKQISSAESATAGATETARRTTSRSKTTAVNTKVTKSVKVAAKAKESTTKTSKVQNKTSKTTSKSSVKGTSKVQTNRSQSSSKQNLSDSGTKPSPVKTRSARGKAVTQGDRSKPQKATAKNKVSKITAGKKKSSPAAKRSTRQK